MAINPINALSASPLTRIDETQPKIGLGDVSHLGKSAPTQGFGQLLDGLVSTVEGKEMTAQDLSRNVLLGQNDQLHQSVIAMQEASVAFGMMIQVRNKLVESYQELMRMQV